MGRKLWVDDPNQSHFVGNVKARRKEFTYNDFNELEKETDTNNESIRYDMDVFGRITHRYSDDGNASFVWDTKKKGLLTSEFTPDVSKDYDYDALARVEKVTTTIDSSVYEVETQYDSNFGRPKSIKYPNQLTVGFKYNAYGYLTHEQNASSLYVYREITASDNYGNTTGSKIGNGRLTGSSIYSASTGQMLNTKVEKNGIALHYLDYENYDSYGNIITQKNLVSSIDTTDSFEYDELHRLKKSTTSASSISATIDYSYDAAGNLTSKSDYSTTNNAYLYENGSNRLISVALKGGSEREEFGYDENGNQTSRSVVNISTNNTTSSGSVTYNVFNKPTYINRLGSQVSLSYDANWSRYKQVRTVGDRTIETHYIDKLYEVEIENGVSRSSSFVSDVAIIIERLNNQTIRFTHNDRLGSTSTFTDHYGNVTAYRSYDPFGKPKMGDGSLMSSLGLRARLSNNLADSDMPTRRGFTSHEHLDEVEIIHMNGRVYDYNVGRFMSVDPFIQGHGNSQGINPYSYVMNNPLGYTDPTGYSAEETVEFDADEVASIDIYEDGSITVNFNNGAESQSFAGAAVAFDGNNVDLGSQADVGKSSTSPGQSNKGSSSTSAKSNSAPTRKNDSGGSKTGDQTSIGDYDGPAVDAKVTDVGYDEEGNLNYVQTTCDRECLRDVRNASRTEQWSHFELMQSLIRTRYLQSQQEILDKTIEYGTYASYVFIGAEVWTALAVRWVLLNGRQKILAATLVTDQMTLATGGYASYGGIATMYIDDLTIRIYNAAKIKPNMRVSTAPGKPKFRVDNKGNPID